MKERLARRIRWDYSDAIMKIAFIGAHGVGKTTLCYEAAVLLKKRDRNVELVKEVARSCPLPINRDTTLTAQAWILHTQIAEEIRAAELDATVLCDRSVLDNYAYLECAAGPRPEFAPLVRSWIATYDHLFKVPITTDPAFDGIRDLDVSFQRRIDALVDELLERFEVEHHRLDPDMDRDLWALAVGRELLPPGGEQRSLF